MQTGKRGASLRLRSTSPEQTRTAGAALGRLLCEGDVVLLHGELGTGKTTFTQGLARGAGSDELVNSPTFVLVNEYRGRIPIYHADLYRLEDPDDVAALDLSGASLDGALVVEWPERGQGLLPGEHLMITIQHIAPEERELCFAGHGPRAEALLRGLAEELPPPPTPSPTPRERGL
jgi:tRNA threonylcarbamoyladenosine biosynthesis protein TsaE